MTGAKVAVGAAVWLVQIDRLSVSHLVQALEVHLRQTPETAAPEWQSPLNLIRILGAEPSKDPKRTSAQLALRLVLARHVEPCNLLEPFTQSEFGKPYLAGSGLHFSLAHSGARALIAISSFGEVGCDIEAPRTPRLPEPKRALIVAAAINVARGAPLSATTEDERFLQAWVRLEAASKWSGEGMGRLLTRYGIFGTDQDRALLPATLSQSDANLFRIVDLPIDQRYAAAIALAANAEPPTPLQYFPTEPDALRRFLG